MEFTNLQIQLVARSISVCGFPDERDLNAMVDLLTQLKSQIKFDSDNAHLADRCVDEALDDLEIQSGVIYTEREAQEARERELEYELEPEGEEE